MNRRRLMLAVGAALLVGGWGAMQYAKQQSIVVGTPGDVIWKRLEYWPPSGRIVFGAGVAAMAVGAGLIGFAVLRERKDE